MIIPELLTTWGVIGYVAIVITPKVFFCNLTRLQSVIVLMVLGPIAWLILFPIACLRLRLEKRDD